MGLLKSIVLATDTAIPLCNIARFKANEFLSLLFVFQLKGFVPKGFTSLSGGLVSGLGIISFRSGSTSRHPADSRHYPTWRSESSFTLCSFGNLLSRLLTLSFHFSPCRNPASFAYFLLCHCLHFQSEALIPRLSLLKMVDIIFCRSLNPRFHLRLSGFHPLIVT